MEFGRLFNFSKEMFLLMNNFSFTEKSLQIDLKVVENLIEFERAKK